MPPESVKPSSVSNLPETTGEATIRFVLFSFRGRISRTDFWLKGILVLLVVYFDLLLLSIASIRFVPQMLGPGRELEAGMNIIIGSTLFTLAWVLFSGWCGITMTVKRLHDHGKSGWYFFTLLLPPLLILFYKFDVVTAWFTRGTIGPNCFGPDPLDRSIRRARDDDRGTDSLARPRDARRSKALAALYANVGIEPPPQATQGSIEAVADIRYDSSPDAPRRIKRSIGFWLVCALTVISGASFFAAIVIPDRTNYLTFEERHRAYWEGKLNIGTSVRGLGEDGVNTTPSLTLESDGKSYDVKTTSETVFINLGKHGDQVEYSLAEGARYRIWGRLSAVAATRGTIMAKSIELLSNPLEALASTGSRGAALEATPKLEDKEAVAARLRLARANSSTDQVELTKLVLEAPEVGVRLAAVSKITDATTLTRIAHVDSDKWVRESAVIKLTDPVELARIAREDGDAQIRMVAVGEIEKLEVLDALASDATDADVRTYAARVASRHRVYLVDTSGSMLEVFGQLRDKLKRGMAAQLRDEFDFQVICFSEGVLGEYPTGKLAAGTADARAEALKFLEWTRVEGQAWLLPALKHAFDTLDAADPAKKGKILYLFTDGGFLDQENDIRSFLAARNPRGEVKIMTYLIVEQDTQARPVDVALLQAISKENAGQYAELRLGP